MPTLHALLVGIQHYANPKHDLRGAATDMREMDTFLQAYCERNGFKYNPLCLANEEATRQAVIDGFGHFSSANKEDCCLFFFSGHGSRYEAPEVFWGLEPDHSLESIVCHDSRIEAGHDLMDKELSYLIWEASKRTELPFISISDSCHSGRLRDLPAGQNPRVLEEVPCTLVPEKFTGYAFYQKTADGQLSPPQGRRVHLAAARDVEFANEIDAGGGRIRGIFTYCLIEALQQFGTSLSYSELQQRVNQRIINNRFVQSAQLDATFTEDRNLGFLFEKIGPQNREILVVWDRSKQAWIAHAGILQGIPVSENGKHNTLKIKQDGHIVTLTQVLPTYSLVAGMEGYETKHGYKAVIHTRCKPALMLGFTPDSKPEIIAEVQSYLDQNAAGWYVFGETAPYIIDAGSQALGLMRAQEGRSLFPEPLSKESLLEKLDSIATWQNLLDLNNTDAESPALPVEIKLFRTTEAGNFSDEATAMPVDWQQGENRFQYFDEKMPPAFQALIRNTGTHGIWVSLLYLDTQFNISNQLIPKQYLGPGAEIWGRGIFLNQYSKSIPLFISSMDLEAGITVREEYLKLLISTRELNTDHYNQGTTASLSREARPADLPPEVPDQDWWKALTIPLRIELVPHPANGL